MPDLLTRTDKRILEEYCQYIYGCSVDDLSDKEFNMLVGHVRTVDTRFEGHPGLQPAADDDLPF